MDVIVLTAMTADGMIAKKQNHFIDWTCPEDKREFVAVTKKAGVVIMGHNTYKTIGVPLEDRLNIVYSRSSRHSPIIENLEFTQVEPGHLLSDLACRGYEQACIIGGTSIYGMFMPYATHLNITISPRLFGMGLSFSSIPIEKRLRLISFGNWPDGSVSLKYEVK